MLNATTTTTQDLIATIYSSHCKLPIAIEAFRILVDRCGYDSAKHHWLFSRPAKDMPEQAPVATPDINLDAPIENLTFEHGSVKMVALAKKSGREVKVHIYSGFYRGTNNAIGSRSTVYPGDVRWSDAYPVLGTYFGGNLSNYIREGVEFFALTGEPIFEPSTEDADRDELAQVLKDCAFAMREAAMYLDLSGKSNYLRAKAAEAERLLEGMGAHGS